MAHSTRLQVKATLGDATRRRVLVLEAQHVRRVLLLVERQCDAYDAGRLLGRVSQASSSAMTLAEAGGAPAAELLELLRRQEEAALGATRLCVEATWERAELRRLASEIP